MDIRKVKKLIELIDETGVFEIEIKEGEESVRISRGAAGTAAPQMKWAHTAATDGAIVEKAGYRNYKRWCGKWTRKCTRRWGWGTKRYGRCMWRHGC